MRKVLLKVSGPEDFVKKFLEKIQKVYDTAIAGRLLLNDQGDGVHCFMDVDLDSEVKACTE